MAARYSQGVSCLLLQEALQEKLQEKLQDKLREKLQEDEMTDQNQGTHPVPFPVEPLYDLMVAAMFIPMRVGALRTFLWRHKAQFPARYRRSGHGRIRMLSASEIRAIRERSIIYQYHKGHHKTGSQTSISRGPDDPTPDQVGGIAHE